MICTPKYQQLDVWLYLFRRKCMCNGCVGRLQSFWFDDEGKNRNGHRIYLEWEKEGGKKMSILWFNWKSMKCAIAIFLFWIHTGDTGLDCALCHLLIRVLIDGWMDVVQDKKYDHNQSEYSNNCWISCLHALRKGAQAVRFLEDRQMRAAKRANAEAYRMPLYTWSTHP